ncbi:MAG: substrate-binding domain-containing protein [Catenulispora sp.]|nr:substrate-binding domain-containing protein [Catenulispora sp.]
MNKQMLRVLVAGAAAGLALSACSSGKSVSSNNGSSNNSSGGSTSAGSGKKPFIGVILPDSKSSVRWETQDRPSLEAAFKAKGLKYDIQNAQGDKNQFQTIGDQMLNEGVTVLVIVDLDSGSGSAVLQKAKSQGVATIDYDRLTLGGGADYYVSYDNVAVGKLQGQGLVSCLGSASKPVVAEVNGAPTDNNATLFAQGYNSVLDPKYADGTFVKGPNQSVPGWDNPTAGTIFEQMLTSTPNIGGVLVANDGMAQSVIAILKKQHLNGKVPVTGQDASVAGLQSVLAGDQCMTVFKDTKKEAAAASELAIDLANGTPATSATATVHDPQLNKDVKSVLLTPEAITKTNINDVITAGGATKDQVCTPDFAKACTDAGIG